jgi:osmotically-inducible protein OsmY
MKFAWQGRRTSPEIDVRRFGMRSFHDEEDRTRFPWLAFAAGASAGAAAMSLIDPTAGARRRALVRDKMSRATHKTASGLDAARRDVSNRTYGRWAASRRRGEDSAVPDPVLVERVRARLGRYVSHPHALDVDADNGRVTLRGMILTGEVPRLMRAIARVRGVSSVDNRLEQHDEAGTIPSLQGGAARTRRMSGLVQRNWSPAVRTFAGGIGSALVMYGAARRDRAGTLLGFAGTALALRAATDLETKRMTRDAARQMRPSPVAPA